MRGATCRERCRAPKKPSRGTKVDAENKKERNGNRARRRRRDLESASQTPSRRRETLSRKRRVHSASAHPLPTTKTTNNYERVPLAPIAPTSCTGSRRPCPLSLARDLCRRDLCRRGHRRDLFDRHGHRRGQNRAKIRLCQMLRPLFSSCAICGWCGRFL